MADKKLNHERPEGYDLVYISTGFGVQSTLVAALSVIGPYKFKGRTITVPRADCAIFADTKGEVSDTYEYVKFMKKWLGERGMEVHVVSRGSLAKAALKGADHRNAFISIPAYTKGEGDEREGILRRQCTREFKVDVINQKIRSLLGLEKGQRAAGKYKALGMIGISMDEIMRMKPSRVSWIEHMWPLIDNRLNREDCKAILRDIGLPEPTKSSCYFCPFHDDHYWQWLKDERPVEFGKAIDFDKGIRNLTEAGVERPIFLHRSCKPLDQVVFNPKDQFQLDLFNNECEGFCGV